MPGDPMDDAVSFFRANRHRLHQAIKDYVDHESPSGHERRLDELAERIEADCVRLGATIDRPPLNPRPVCARFGSGPARLALVFHHDTVWPLGSFPDRRYEGDRWSGPGIFDMKANIPLVLLALEFIRGCRPKLLEGLVLVSSPDEETMGPVSREHLPPLLGGCRWALVFEPPTAEGAFKNRRKGVGRTEVRFEGIAAHAGNHYEKGKSALAAAARFLLAAEALTDLDRGLTVNVGWLHGGSSVNTRPAAAELGVDVRVMNPGQWRLFQSFVRNYRDPLQTVLTYEEQPLIPPMAAEHEGWAVLEEIQGALGLPFRLALAGGASDGSHLAARGVRVLDGLGVGGGGEHASDEHILAAAVQPCFQRTVLLIKRLLERDDLPSSAAGRP